MSIIKKLISRLLPVFILGIFFSVQFFFLSRKTQSLRFVDESEHLIPALEITNQNKTLYKDLSTIHQPIPILTAYVFWKFIPVANFFMLIERVRQFVFVISFFGAVLLTLRFKVKGLVAAILVEAVKFYFLGFHLLAESLVVYPVMFIGGLLLDKKRSRPDDISFGICVFLTAFNLLPTWPFLLAATAFYLILRKSLSAIAGVGISILIPTLLLFMIVNPFSWFRETIINNLVYFIPSTGSSGIYDLVRFSIYPILSVSALNQVVAKYYFFLSLFCLLALLFGSRNIVFNIKRTAVFLFFYLLLISLNLRVTGLNIGFYSAFHVLPQAAFFTMAAVALIFRQNIKILYIFTVVIFALSIGWWLEAVKTDKLNEHYINYGDEESLGMALAAIKNKDDTLLAGPQSFLNLASDIPLATRQTAYLPWSWQVPELNNELTVTMRISPPTFIFFPEMNNPYYYFLAPILEEKYKRIERTFGSQTDLYILANKTDINSRQWDEFKRLLYQPL